MRRILAVLILVAAVVALVAFRPTRSSTTHADPEVAVTIFPLYDIVRNIAGDAVDVKLILPPGASPHTFEPTPSDVAAINDTRVVYRVGFGLDDWATNIADAKTDVLTLSADLDLRTTENGIVDPHYWLTINNAKHMATLAAQDLGSHFPDYRAQFQTNLTTYLAALNNTDTQLRAIFAETPNKNIVTMHDAWYYFAEEYGLTIVGAFEPEAAEEPTPHQLALLQKAIATADVHTVYVDADANPEGIASFANDNALALVIVDAEGVTYNSYIDLMLGNAQLISQNR